MASALPSRARPTLLYAGNPNTGGPARSHGLRLGRFRVMRRGTIPEDAVPSGENLSPRNDPVLSKRIPQGGTRRRWGQTTPLWLGELVQ